MGFGNARHDRRCKSSEEHECEHDDSLHFDLTPFFLSLTTYEGDNPQWRRAASNFGKNAQDAGRWLTSAVAPPRWPDGPFVLGRSALAP
jgi:hypothetical protein